MMMTDFELDLNDPDTIERLKSADVLAAPKPEPAEIKEKIADLRKKHTFSMRLTQAQVDILTREGQSRGIDWKAQLEYRILCDVFDGVVGTATITSPSYCAGPKVVGPSGGGLVTRG
jgi:hypothetical protein